MKCKDCSACRKGFFKSKPDKYVCTGVKEPFIVNDIKSICTEYPKREMIKQMSMEKKYYVIAGYDLTGWKTYKFDDWKWTDDGEKYTCYQSKGHVQLFDDPASGGHLYFGYVLADGDEYDFKATKFNMNDVNDVLGDVKAELITLIELGVISKSPNLNPEYQIIAFEEYR